MDNLAMSKLLEQGLAGVIVAVIIVPLMYLLFKEMRATRELFHSLLQGNMSEFSKVLGEMRTVLERLSTLLESKLK